LKTLNYNVALVLIIIGIAVLAYTSYQAGYKAKKNEMDCLLMTMTIDSNFVTAGLYEELPNQVRKTMHFYIEDTPTVVNDIKLYAEVKYATIGGEVVNTDDGRIWNLVKRDRIFERKFEKKNESENGDYMPNSPFAQLNKVK
jgi:hypothetical protein